MVAMNWRCAARKNVIRAVVAATLPAIRSDHWVRRVLWKFANPSWTPAGPTNPQPSTVSRHRRADRWPPGGRASSSRTPRGSHCAAARAASAFSAACRSDSSGVPWPWSTSQIALPIASDRTT